MKKTMRHWLSAGVAVASCSLVSLRAAASGAEQDIRDIRGPIVEPAPTPWITVVAIAAVSLVVAYGVSRLVRALRNRPRDPYSVAKSRLEQAEAHLGETPPHQFAEDVSQALRDYMQAHFPLRAVHRTREELVEDLLERTEEWPELARHRPLVDRLLSRADEAKFAGASLSLEQLRALHETATLLLTALHEDYLARQKRARKARRAARTQSQGAAA